MAPPGIMRRILLAGLFCASLLVTMSQSVGAAQQESPDEGPVVNLELILDASGSMSEEIEPGVARIDAAKQALNAVIDALPLAGDVNVGVRVYGHKGANTPAGRAESCQSTELTAPIQGVDPDALRAEVAAYEPVGWTPLTLALLAAQNDFPAAEDGIENHVVLMTDGLETCGGDPSAASRQIKNGPKAITTHVIGFALAPDEQEELRSLVDASGGLLQGASNAEELQGALFFVLKEIEVIQTSGFLEIEQFGGVFPLATVTREIGSNESGSDDAEPAATPEATETTFSFTTSNEIEVPAGRYMVAWTNPSGAETMITVVVEVGETTLIRGSMLRLPTGGSEVYEITAIDGTVIWADSVDFGDVIWVLPGAYRVSVVEPAPTTMILSMVVQTLPGVVTEVTVTTES